MTRDGARPRQRRDASSIACRYLVGCDGGRSAVRKQIGATLDGTPVIQRVQSTYIRAPELLRAACRGKPAWAYFSLNPRRCGTVFAIDGRETWLVHNYLRRRGARLRLGRPRLVRSAQILGVGADFRYEVISKEDWIGRRLVADRFRDRPRLHLRATRRTSGCPMPATA